MEKYRAQQLAKWLDITDQQLDILMSIYRLQVDGVETSPKHIAGQYIADYGGGLQKSNLFAQIRNLIAEGLVIKEKKGVYCVNLDTMDHILGTRRSELEGELHEFDQISSEAREYFKKTVLSTIKHSADFLTYSDLYKAITMSIKNATTLYLTCDFPTIAYPYSTAKGIGRDNYTKAIWDRCFDKNELEVKYLTNLDVDLPFNHALRTCGDRQTACSEMKLIIEQLANQSRIYSMLDIRYTRDLHCLDVVISEKNEPREFFLYTKDEHKNIIGGFHIRSAETSISAKNMFLHEFEYAEPLRGLKGGEILEGVRERLEKKYMVTG